MSLKKQLIDFTEKEPKRNSKIILFFPPESRQYPKACYYDENIEYSDSLSYIAVDNEILEKTWLYLNICQLLNI
jgi:hypothetical protein